MKHSRLIAALLPVILTATIFTSCKQSGQSSASTSTAAVDSSKLPELKGDDNINQATRFYAGISKDGINMPQKDAEAWGKYSKEISRLLDISKKTTKMVDSLANADFSDFRNKIDLVFYPFSGADFPYPITIFPNADTYILCGLEKTGSPFSSEIKTNYAHYESYRKALVSFMRLSYFITKDMKNDLDNEEIDGVCPVIAMLMATLGYDIISIENKAIDENGKLIPGEGKGNVMQYKFFKRGSKHEQTLYYVSADVEDKRVNPNVNKFFEVSLQGHTVATYLKAASYLMHQHNFSKIRGYVVDNSQYIVQDDSGVPYKHLTDKFDLTFYGVYKRPLQVFTEACIQPDLDQAYKDNADKVRPLPFHIGYNNPSNWQCARRKSGK